MQTTFGEEHLAGRLVASGDAEAEERVRRDLLRISEAVHEAFPTLLTLAVIGAFGRGEGAVVASEQGPAPWNDYDLLLVTPTRWGWDRIGSVCTALKDELALPGLDIVPFTPGDLRRSSDTMLVHDARACHVVLAGSAAPLEMLPERRVPLREALTLLLNRAVCLLEHPPQDLTGHPPDPLLYPSQVSKVILAVVDATLVRRGAYVVSYRDKVARFRECAPDAAMVRAAEAALAFRLRPEPLAWGSDAWHRACAWLLSAIGELADAPASSPPRLAAALWQRRFAPYGSTARSLLRGRPPDCRRRAVECAEILVLGASREAGDGRQRMLRSAQAYLRLAGSASSSADWAAAASETVRRWFEVCYG